MAKNRKGSSGTKAEDRELSQVTAPSSEAPEDGASDVFLGKVPETQKTIVSRPVDENSRYPYFVSIHKNLIVHAGGDKYYEFKGRFFQPASEEEYEDLKKNSAFNKLYFEKTYPAYIIEKFKKDREYLTQEEGYYDDGRERG